jgi:hypothetical protein
MHLDASGLVRFDDDLCIAALAPEVESERTGFPSGLGANSVAASTAAAPICPTSADGSQYDDQASLVGQNFVPEKY